MSLPKLRLLCHLLKLIWLFFIEPKNEFTLKGLLIHEAEPYKLLKEESAMDWKQQLIATGEELKAYMPMTDEEQMLFFEDITNKHPFFAQQNTTYR